jgi:hypothetical protein
MDFAYKINSTLDLEEVLDSIHEQLDLKEGILTYYEGESHEEIKENLSIKELKEKTIEVYNDDKCPSVESEGLEITLDEDSIEIYSNRELDLKEFDLIEE